MAQGISRMWFIAPAAVLLLVVVTWWSAKSQQSITNALTGSQDAVVTLAVPGGDPARVGRWVAERLAVLGVNATVREAAGEQVVLHLGRVADAEVALKAVLRPQPLAFRAILSDQGVADADAGEGERPYLTGTSRGEVAGKLGGDGAVLECMGPKERGAPTLCAAWRVGPPAPLGTAQVERIEVSADPKTEEPLLTLTFTAEGARHFEALSAQHVGQRIAVVALGEVQARPLIEAPIKDGVWRFSTRTADTDRTEAVARAQRIAASHKLPVLPEVRVVKVEVPRPPPR